MEYARLTGFLHSPRWFKGMNFDEKDQSAMNNLFEEWSCLVWKILPITILSKALPPGFFICEADIHLN
jgi:hypothetical protein